MSFHQGEDQTTGRLVFDLDFIVEWLTCSNESFRFLVAPATLTFHGVSDLKIAIDYAGCAMGSFEIVGIEREILTQIPGSRHSRWRIPISFPSGEIVFDAEGFVQELRAAPKEVAGQHLSDEERAAG